MRFTCSSETPSFRAIAAPAPYSLGRPRISSTCSVVNFVLLLLSANRIGGFVSRPFAILSRTLSAWVPSHKWRGLAHGGLSHEWQITIPFGMSRPVASAHEKRCALSLWPRQSKKPYPCRIMPTHAQQVGVLTTREKKAHSIEQYFSFGVCRTKAREHWKQLSSMFCQLGRIPELYLRSA